MTKLNFNEVRGFNDSITFTFNFIKQEFKPLLKAFAVIALPLIFIDLFVKSYLVRGTLEYAIAPSSDLDASLSNLVNNLGSYLGSGIIFFWLSLMVISYVKIYLGRYALQSEEPVTAKEVWGIMYPKIGKSVAWGILYVCTVVVGFVCFIIPGIYFSLAFVFTLYFLILRDRPLFAGMADSMNLVKGKWWNLFGYMIVLQLIVGGLSYVFSIPYMVLVFKGAFSQELPGVYETTFGIMLSTLGQYLMQVILIIGIAVRFFSDLEQKEHSALLGKIDQIGTTGAREETL